MKFNYKFKFVIPSIKLITPFFLFALPLFVNYFFSQADTIIERSLTTKMGPGSVSVLDYAKKFSDLPTSLMMSVIVTVLTPLLSLFYVKNSAEELITETQKYFRFMILIALPISIMLIVLPEEAVRMVLVRGQFGQKLTGPTSSLLKWYGVGLFGVIFYLVYTQLAIAQKKVYFFSKVVIVSFLIKIPFNILLYKKLGLETFPISWMLSNFIMGIVLMYSGLRVFKKVMFKDAGSMILLFILLAVINYSIHNMLKNIVHSDFVISVMMLISIIISEVLLVFIFRLDEALLIKKSYNNLKKRLIKQ